MFSLHATYSPSQDFSYWITLQTHQNKTHQQGPINTPCFMPLQLILLLLKEHLRFKKSKVWFKIWHYKQANLSKKYSITNSSKLQSMADTIQKLTTRQTITEQAPTYVIWLRRRKKRIYRRNSVKGISISSKFIFLKQERF